MSDTNEEISADQFKQELQEQIDKIDKAIAALPEGEIDDLQTLDKDVSDLCNRLEKAPREVAQESEPLMSRMISGLEELEQKLRAHQNELNLGNAQDTGSNTESSTGHDTGPDTEKDKTGDAGDTQ